mmetsp:Transcript_63347/g.173970  ORF Transcript_63347/g.173970 Transcript_63347/m.173970 type:complete len:210 (-) Transcript_63347:343-972(-)
MDDSGTNLLACICAWTACFALASATLWSRSVAPTFCRACRTCCASASRCSYILRRARRAGSLEVAFLIFLARERYAASFSTLSDRIASRSSLIASAMSHRSSTYSFFACRVTWSAVSVFTLPTCSRFAATLSSFDTPTPCSNLFSCSLTSLTIADLDACSSALLSLAGSPENCLTSALPYSAHCICNDSRSDRLLCWSNRPSTPTCDAC